MYSYLVFSMFALAVQPLSNHPFAGPYAFSGQLSAVSSPLPTDQAVIRELSLRPLAEATDIYKLLHQSVFGPGHIIQNKAVARDYLLRETASLGPAHPDEALHEDIGNGMQRVNLRPFRDSDGLIEELLETMIEAANTNTGTQAEMKKKLNQACRALKKQNMKLLAKELKALEKKYAALGYPAIHHSQAYRNAYWPAYRVVR